MGPFGIKLVKYKKGEILADLGDCTFCLIRPEVVRKCYPKVLWV